MSPNTDRNAARLLADAGWDQALHGLLAGVVHDVNGRITSIGAMEQLAALEEDLGEAFQTEIERLGGVSERVGWLLGDPDAEATPLFPADVMDRAARLHASAKELSGSDVQVSVPAPAAVPPVLSGETRLLRALVLLLGWAGASGPEVPVRIDGEGDYAVITLEGGVAPGSPTDALGALLALDGGELETVDGAVRIRLLSLAAARAQGR